MVPQVWLPDESQQHPSGACLPPGLLPTNNSPHCPQNAPEKYWPNYATLFLKTLTQLPMALESGYEGFSTLPTHCSSIPPCIPYAHPPTHTPPPPPSGTCQPTCRTGTHTQPAQPHSSSHLSSWQVHSCLHLILSSVHCSFLLKFPSPSSPPTFPTSLICITCSHPSRTHVGSHSPLGSSAWTLPPKLRLVAFPRNVLCSSITVLTTQTYRTASTFLSFCPWLNHKLLDGHEYLLQSCYPNN